MSFWMMIRMNERMMLSLSELNGWRMPWMDDDDDQMNVHLWFIPGIWLWWWIKDGEEKRMSVLLDDDQDQKGMADQKPVVISLTIVIITSASSFIVSHHLDHQSACECLFSMWISQIAAVTSSFIIIIILLLLLLMMLMLTQIHTHSASTGGCIRVSDSRKMCL